MRQPTQQRAVETRDSILRAAAEVFDQCGYAGASINRILESAGATAGSLYFHFKSKEDLARAVIQEQAADLTFPDETHGLQWLVDMTGYLARQMQHNTLFRAGVRLAVEQTSLGLQEYAIYEWWAERFRQELVTAREKGQLMPGVDEAAFASMLVATFTGTQIMSQVSCGRADLPERLADMWRCMLPALTSHHVSATLRLPGAEEAPA